MGNTFTTTPATGGTLFDDATLSLHLKLVTDADLSLVRLYADAAIDYAETAMGTTLLSRTRTAKFYDNQRIYLPNGPILSITSATDVNAKTVTYRQEAYGHADLLVPLVSFVAPLTVVYVAGYANAAAVPASIRAAILAHVGTLYEQRASVSDKAAIPVPHSLEAFYRLKSRNTSIG